MEVSRHAYKRLKERLGLNKKAARRHAEKAFKDGVFPKDYYFVEIGQKYALLQERQGNRMYVFYNDLLYIFGLSAERVPTLVTVYDPIHGEWEKQYVGGRLMKIENIGKHVGGMK